MKKQREHEKRRKRKRHPEAGVVCSVFTLDCDRLFQALDISPEPAPTNGLVFWLLLCSCLRDRIVIARHLGPSFVVDERQ